MKTHIKAIYFTILIISCLMPYLVQAASGSPNSANFNYGVRIDLLGDNPQGAIHEAGSFNLDWIALDFDWQRLQPDADHAPDWGDLDAAMASAQKNLLSVMLSITQAPGWAMDDNGPHPLKTSNLAVELVRRYPNIPLALELFPCANTNLGWGKSPNPRAYASLLKATTQAVMQANPNTIIVGANLTPLTEPSTGMDDSVFLHQLYAEKVAEYLSIVGLRLPPLGNAPLTPTYQADEVLLRHYEDIRSIMVENGHKNGLIWVTGFSWDEGSFDNPNDQAAWMKQAYLLFRAQLYIGSAFFDGLNPSQIKPAALLFHGGDYHPGFEELIQIIAQDHNSQMIQISLGIPKKISPKNHIKGITP